jgi:hypothetical protein
VSHHYWKDETAPCFCFILITGHHDHPFLLFFTGFFFYGGGGGMRHCQQSQPSLSSFLAATIPHHHEVTPSCTVVVVVAVAVAAATHTKTKRPRPETAGGEAAPAGPCRCPAAFATADFVSSPSLHDGNNGIILVICNDSHDDKNIIIVNQLFFSTRIRQE